MTVVYENIFMRYNDKFNKFECLNDPDVIIKYLCDHDSSIPKTIERLLFNFARPPVIKNDELWQYVFYIHFDIPAAVRLIDDNTLELDAECAGGHLFDYPCPALW